MATNIEFLESYIDGIKAQQKDIYARIISDKLQNNGNSEYEASQRYERHQENLKRLQHLIEKAEKDIFYKMKRKSMKNGLVEWLSEI